MGNLETLNKPGIRSVLLDFYEKKYSSNLMKLTLYSNQSIEDIEKLAIAKFSRIQDKKFEVFQFDRH